MVKSTLRPVKDWELNYTAINLVFKVKNLSYQSGREDGSLNDGGDATAAACQKSLAPTPQIHHLLDLEGDALGYSHTNGSSQGAVSTDLPLSTVLHHGAKET